MTLECFKLSLNRLLLQAESFYVHYLRFNIHKKCDTMH